MRSSISSLLSFLFAAMLYALQRLAKLMRAPGDIVDPKNPPAPGPTGEKPRSADGYLYQKTRRLFELFGDPAAVLFLAFEENQSKLVDLAFDIFSGNARRWRKLPRQLGHQLALASASLGAERMLNVQQAKNTRYIFVLVRNNPEMLGIPKSGEFDLACFVDRAYGVGEFENIWTVEGLGHVYSQRIWQLKWNASDDAHGIMVEGQATCLPDKSLTMMHAGLGLCLAESLMKRLTPSASAREVEHVVAAFIKLCRNNSRPGYVGCALESLGLVTRCFNYRLINLVQAVLVEMDPIAWEFFWRGVGRAIYFAPAHLLQPLYSPWIAADQEAPNDRVHEILKSGISWPANIVNMRTPAIFEQFIRRYGAQVENQRAIAQGVASSTTMALDITPDNSVIRAYLEYEPATADPEVRRLWERLVRDPVSKSVHRYQPVLKRHAMMDQVFRLQDLDALVDQLEPQVGLGRDRESTSKGVHVQPV
jgi:hypothetical protein